MNTTLNRYELQPWQWTVLMRYATDAASFGDYVRFILHLAATPPTRQLERHAYPGQPSTRAQHVVQPCSCQYWTQHAILHTWYGDVPSLAYASGFKIHPACPHHGHRANTHLIERLWSDPYSNGILRDPYDMDDDERRGH